MYAASVYGGREDSLGLTILFIVRIFILFMLVLWTLYPVGGLRCDGTFVYPDQIVALMIMDFVNSAVDIVVCAFMPSKVVNKF